ncbi:MAG: fructosamine kinase family protein [Nitriliruptoraceae bacterium]|nr:fructosamine kinase family protein [Nitriliruptoraceae bacterium]
MSSASLPPALRTPLPGLGAVISASPLAGGDVAQVWRATLTDGRAVVVKVSTTPASLEAEGLEALAAAGARVPQVLAVDEGRLALELVTEQGEPAAFGRMLAEVHARPAPRFGWHRDNVIGPLPQRNDPDGDWAGFVARCRLLPHLDALDRADPGGAHTPVTTRLRDALEAGRLHAVLDHDPAPSLVHGDLWSGNVLRWAAMIDPAVHHADREVDLAMLALFGTVPAAMQRAYDEVAPLPDGVERRRLVLQLTPLLVHVRLFGAGYLDAVAHRLDRLGW